MEMFIFARFHARPGNETALAAAITGVLAPSCGEAGCLGSIRDSQLPHIRSRWLNEEAFDAHAIFPHTVRFIERVEPLIDNPLAVTRSEIIA
jgi:quinol monooxygenase YgiN